MEKQLAVDRDVPLQVGIFAKTFQRDSVDEVFEAIAGHGLTCTQWNWACVPGLSSLPDFVTTDTTRRVARAALSSGVRIVAVSMTFNLIQAETRKRALVQRTSPRGRGFCRTLITSTRSCGRCRAWSMETSCRS
jgi:hypothetical protein